MWFKTCDHREEGCLGPVRFHMALAADADHILASTEALEIAPPLGVSTMAPCLAGGDTFFMTGQPDHPLLPEDRSLQLPGIVADDIGVEGDGAVVGVFPGRQDDGLRYLVTLDSTALGVHEDVDLDILIDGPRCRGGSYEIHAVDIDWRGGHEGRIVGLDATFGLTCHDPARNPYPPLVGCIRMTPDSD